MWCVQDVVYPGNVIAMCALAGVACATPRCGPAGTQVAIAWNGIQCGSAADVAAMDIEITCRFGEVEVPASLVVTPLSHQVRMRLEAPHQAAHTAHFACPTPTHYCHLQPDLLYCTAPTSVSGVSELQEGQRLTVPLSVVVSAARTGAGASQGDGRWSTELPLMGLQPRSQTPLASTHTRRNPALLPPVHADTLWACWCGCFPAAGIGAIDGSGNEVASLVSHQLMFEYTPVGANVTCGCSRNATARCDLCGTLFVTRPMLCSPLALTLWCLGGHALLLPGVCSTRSEAEYRDCDGTCFGSASIDRCGQCTGGSTGRNIINWLELLDDPRSCG